MVFLAMIDLPGSMILIYKNMMKRIILFLTLATIAVAGCKKVEEDPKGPVIERPGDIVVGDDEAVNVTQQKKKLDQVAQKLMEVFPATEYEDIVEMSAELTAHCDRYFYDEEYNWDELEQALGEIGESLYDEKQTSENKWTYTYSLFFSNCTGVVTMEKNRARYKESSESKLIIKDVNGNDWEISIVPMGLRKVYLGEIISVYNDDYYDEYTEVYDVTVEIPSNLSCIVKKNGKDFASVSLSFEYDIDEEGLNLETDMIGLSLEIKIDDIVMEIKKASYDAETGKLEFSQSLKKGGYFIFSQQINGDMKMITEEEDGEMYIVGWDGEAEIYFNILGEIQIKGTCEDMAQLQEYVSGVYYSENECDRAASRANALLNLGLYYDGTSVQQARISFESVVSQDYNGEECFWIEPILVFNDDSRYSFEEYFDDDIFEELIKDFEDFLYGYEDMIENIYE